MTFNYDTAATIAVAGWSGSGMTPATNIPIGVANTSLQPFGAYTYAPGTASLAPLFPYPSGYTVFAGNCTDSNPVGLDTSRNAFYPTPGTVATNVTPGGTTSATVPLYDLPVKVVNSVGAPVAGATITASETTGYAAPNTAVCMNGGATGTPPTYGLVASDAAGMSNNAVPLGHLTVRAQSGPKSGTVKIWRNVTGIFNVTSGGATTGSRHSPRHRDGDVRTGGRARRRRAESGYTLIELMVAMGLLSVVVAAAFQVVVVDAAFRAGDDEPFHGRGRGADHRRPHHQGHPRRGHRVARPAPRSCRPTRTT